MVKMRIDSKKKTVVGRSHLIFNIFQEIRESSFNMTRGGMKILRGGSENF